MIGSYFHYFLCISDNVFHLFFTVLLDVFHFSFLFLDYFKSTFPSYYIQNITTLFYELPTYYQQFYLILANIIRLQIFYLHKSKPLGLGFRTPAFVLSLASSIDSIQSSGQIPRPIFIKVPTMIRTMCTGNHCH